MPGRIHMSQARLRDAATATDAQHMYAWQRVLLVQLVILLQM